MNEKELVLDMLKQTFDGRSWHGPPLKAVLKDVDKTQARGRLVEGRHTIWELVDHCAYWMEAVNHSLRGEDMPDIKTGDDWPLMGKSDADWARSMEQLTKTHEELVNTVHRLNPESYTRKVKGSYNGQPYSTTIRTMLHGISDHNTYHAGQIALLRKKTM